MDFLPHSGRLLYDPGFETWDHNFGGYVTNYVIVVTCSVLLLISWSKLGCKTSEGKQLIAYLATQGLAFGLGGLAHDILDSYFRAGENMGRSWAAENSAWMYPWLFSMVFASLNGGATLSIAFSFTGLPSWMGIITYVIGALIGGYEFYIFVFTAEGMNTTGTCQGYFMLFGSLVAVITFAVSFFRQYCNGERHDGLALQCCIGMTVILSGLIVLATAPPSCKTVGEERAGCPYPEAFNQNAVFHIITMVGVIIMVTGCWKLNEKSEFALLEQ